MTPPDNKKSVSRRWIDAHCHLADERFAADRSEMLARSRAAGISGWIQGGINPEDWERQLELRKVCGDALWTSFGLHPWWVARADDSVLAIGLQALEKKISEADALGETGLDFSPKHDSAEGTARQEKIFEQQLALAQRARKPLVLHIVHAHEPALAILEKLAPFPDGGLVHAFAASWELAQRYLRLGFLLSVGGVVTRDGYKPLKNTVPKIPGEHLVVETDSPDLPPAHLLGQRNEPHALFSIAEAIARLRGETAESVLDQSADNLRRLFKKTAKT